MNLEYRHLPGKTILLVMLCLLLSPAGQGLGAPLVADNYNSRSGYDYQDDDRNGYSSDYYDEDYGLNDYQSDHDRQDYDQNGYRQNDRRRNDYRRQGRDRNAPDRQKKQMAKFAEEVFRRTNAERVKRNIPPLRSIMVLSVVADKRAIEISRNYRSNHTRPDGRSWSTILHEHNIKWTACGENIAEGQDSPAEVVSGWMNSPGHRRNILNKEFTHLGVGIRRNAKGSLCWTQNFVQLGRR